MAAEPWLRRRKHRGALIASALVVFSLAAAPTPLLARTALDCAEGAACEVQALLLRQDFYRGEIIGFVIGVNLP